MAAIALLIAGCATSEPIRGAALEDLAFDLSIYAARQSGLPSMPPPAIVFVDDIHAVAADRRNPLADKADALYDPREETIYLPATWNGNGVVDRVILVHEITHHLQFGFGSAEAFHAHFSGRYPDLPLCLRTIEREACAVAVRYYLDESRRLPRAGRTVADVCEEMTSVYSCDPEPR